MWQNLMTVRPDSYCGLYCGACFVVRAERENLQKELVKKYSNLKPEEVKCQGCKSEGYVFRGCQKCKIRQCAQEKKLEFCFECSEYPCEKIEHFKNTGLAHTFVACHSLKDIQQKGLATWLKQQKVRWECPKCHKSFSWLEEKCSQCGEVLYNSQVARP